MTELVLVSRWCHSENLEAQRNSIALTNPAPDDVITAGTVDISQSASPFVFVQRFLLTFALRSPVAGVQHGGAGPLQAPLAALQQLLALRSGTQPQAEQLLHLYERRKDACYPVVMTTDSVRLALALTAWSFCGVTGTRPQVWFQLCQQK